MEIAKKIHDSISGKWPRENQLWRLWLSVCGSSCNRQDQLTPDNKHITTQVSDWNTDERSNTLEITTDIGTKNIPTGNGISPATWVSPAQTFSTSMVSEQDTKGWLVYQEWWTSQCYVHMEKDDQQISIHRCQNHLRKKASRAAIKKKNVPILSCEKSLNQ